MVRVMKRLLLFVLLASSLALANDPTIRICVGSIENHSSFQLPMDDFRASFVKELSHKNITAVSITGNDVAAEMTRNHCDYLLRAEFMDSVSIKPGETANVGGIVVDNRKRYALSFGFELRKNLGEEPLLSDHWGVIDKNPKTCVDDHLYEAVTRIRDHFKKG